MHITSTETNHGTFKSPNKSDHTDDMIPTSDDSQTALLHGYNVIAIFIDPNYEMYNMWLDGHFGHIHSYLPINTEVNQRRKLSCILCFAKYK